MRLARIGPVGAEVPAASGADGIWRDLRSITRDLDGAALQARLGPITEALESRSLPELALGARFGAPLVSVGKIVCVGLNYRDHAAETQADLPAEPILFLKAADTVTGPDDPVTIPRGSRRTDWEVELAVVIGQTARYLDSEAEAAACVAGYAISNDVSEREFQLDRGGQWDKGKNCETFNPFGPWICTTDEVPDPQSLALQLSVNDRIRQRSTTREMIFGVRHLVWYVSQFMVLYPGDVINTGTPAGVALGQPDHPYLRAGDVVSLSIEGLGSQRQTFVAAS